jgi:hypothetical protein
MVFDSLFLTDGSFRQDGMRGGKAEAAEEGETSPHADPVQPVPAKDGLSATVEEKAKC